MSSHCDRCRTEIETVPDDGEPVVVGVDKRLPISFLVPWVRQPVF